MGGKGDGTEVSRLKARVAELERLLKAQQPEAASPAGRPDEVLPPVHDQTAMLRTLMVNTASLTGDEYFRALVTSLVSTLGVRCAFVGEVVGDRPGYMRTLALCLDGGLRENFEYALAGTPCEQIVKGRRMLVFPRGIRQQFPDDRWLVEAGMESYLGLPLFNEAGDVIGLVGVIHDAPMAADSQALSLLEAYVARVGAELRRLRLLESLQESEGKYRLLFSHAMDAVVLFDVHTHQLLDVNDEAVSMYGYSRQEFLRLKILDLSAEPDASDAAIQRAADAGGAYVPLRWNKKKDGTVFPVEISCGPFTWKGRTVMCGVLRDITERKQAEDRLRESAEKLQAILDHSPAMVFLKDTEGRYLLTNRRFEQAFHWTREAVIGKTDAQLFPPAQAEAFIANDRQVLRSGMPLEFEEVAMHDDGPHTSIVVKFPLYDAEGAIFAIGGITTDVTERKRAEEERKHLEDQLRQAAKMEAVGRLAGGIAHDFNNLLTVIMGHSDLLLRRLDDDDPSSKHADEIKKAGRHAANLTGQLLAFGRRQVTQPKVLDLNGLVTETTELLRRLIGENVRLVTDLPADPCPVKADPDQLAQVLMNLAVNARDAMPEGGTLTLETLSVEGETAQHSGRAGLASGPYVKLTVRDTGCGMDADTKTHIFEPFFTTKDRLKGTGLGLAMVYGIIAQHGGTVAVDSAPGQGAAFTIYLPRASGTVETAGEPERQAGTVSGSETILLVEDDQVVRTFVRDLLVECGYDVVEAAGAEEALRWAERHQGPIHLLLTDVIMPGLSGRQLAERIGAMRPDTKVLFMSGYTGDIVIRYGLQEMGAEFIQKPFNAESLERQVRALLDTPRG
ncbi:MAG: PAS domain S-box protein [Nitrospira sp.]|nr:PAS domain S-box protein [Nitrospira sp.]